MFDLFNNNVLIIFFQISYRNTIIDINNYTILLKLKIGRFILYSLRQTQQLIRLYIVAKERAYNIVVWGAVQGHDEDLNNKQANFNMYILTFQQCL